MTQITGRAGGGAGGAGLLPDRHPSADFFICDIFGAAPKDDLGSMEHPIFSLATRPDCRILSYTHNGTDVTVTPSVRGRATIHDKDVLIYCISQLMAALNAGRAISRRLHLRAHDLLVATNRDTSGDAYARLREAFERLAGTRVTTNIATGGLEITQGFGLIESWEIVRRARVQGGRVQGGRMQGGAEGRMLSVTVTLSEWIWQAVLSKSVLTLHRDYFRLRKPLERRIYELVRKHCGRQPEWRVSVAVLHKKSGSASPLRVFRAALRRIIVDANLPDYTMAEEVGDLIRFARPQAQVSAAEMLRFDADVLDAARARAPGQDVHALETRWRAFWAASGRPRLGSPERAFLAWVAGQTDLRGA